MQWTEASCEVCRDQLTRCCSSEPANQWFHKARYTTPTLTSTHNNLTIQATVQHSCQLVTHQK